MKKIKFEQEIESFDLDELNAADIALLLKAKEATKISYSPYSNFRVGCAILLEGGAVVIGANQENAAYPVCLCAEGVALANAAANYPKVPIVSMAITVDTEKKNVLNPVAPCGLCRQSILEYENRQGKKIQLLLQGESNLVYKVNSIKDLLPLHFSDKDLK